MLKKHNLAAILMWTVLLTAVSLCSWGAKPTISGMLKNYNPGGGRLQIQRDDGSIKNVVLRENCHFMMHGSPVSSAAFRINMRVAVRICGSLSDDPLEADLITDAASSGRYVSTKANSPGFTPMGSFANVGGAGGVVGNNPAAVVTPSVLGPLGMGGNAPGSLTNPGINGPVTNSVFPAIPQASSTAAIGPSPLGSPFTGQVISQMSPQGSTMPPAQSGAANNPYAQPGANNNPYANQNPYASPNIYGMTDPNAAQGASPSLASLIGNNDKDEEENNTMIPSTAQGPLGMQIVEFQGRIMSVDARNRTFLVVPNGSNQTMQVSLPKSVPPLNVATNQAIEFGRIQPGMGIIVQGLANTAGIIEARQCHITR